MHYRTVPKNGDRLSALGYGAMRLPTRMGRVDEGRAIRQIRSAIEGGVNYVDTAYPYHGGESERVLGRALRDGYREQVKIADKLTPWLVASRAEMETMLAVQLKRLQTDHIDYYLLHMLDARSWKKLVDLDVFAFLEAAREAGTITNIGFSFHGDRKTFRAIIDAYDWTMCQVQYNLLDEDLQAGREGLDYAASQGIAVMVMEPLRGGMLARDLPAGAQAAYDRSGLARNPADWALRWVLDHPGVTTVLSGMNDERHIQENLQTCEDALPGSMTAAEHAVVDEVKAAYRRQIRIDCTGCAYCMPCPFGVDIPQCFHFYNQYHMGGTRLLTRGFYIGQVIGFEGDPANASRCRHCGKCLEACPQGIAIPDELEKVAHDLDGLSTKLMIPLVKMVMTKRQKE
ncbi:putative aldo/keto reductase-like oxidoreductase [Methanofollis sp. W23]|uniref:aldo/keto reductase n=1 Tax=Methanofollis sp. W23 TaxID=2817849 RepID=UPI001AE349FB|nr:aldo/keto reductase [Methanofollis sp. W23]MBP2146202.1 putative aldo/keto reductase-like oxidoreductase [Methanofollis sp. W23]